MLIDLIHNVPHVDEIAFSSIRESGAPVALFGAGDMARYIAAYLREHKIEPAYICDNNLSKQGTFHAGIPVGSYKRFREIFDMGKYHIVVTVGLKYLEEIYAQLAASGEKNPIWYLCGYELCGPKFDYIYFHNNLSMFEAAYTSLSDAFSQKVFVNVLNAKLTGDFSLYEEIKSNNLYFDKDLFKLGENEIFLDVGAYTGNAIVEFAKFTQGKYEGIIAFEPDRKTSEILIDTAKRNQIKHLEIHNCGAWNKHDFLHFEDGREGSSRIHGLSDGDVPSANSIEVNTIDNVLHGRRVTYISMDIEGAEHNAILGAEQTIKKWKPKMAVCVYHKREDMFDLLLLLKSFVPDYKFYLRHYTCDQTETVLYAQ